MTDSTNTTTAAPAPKKRRWVTPVLSLVAALALGVFGGVLIGHNTSSSTQASSGAGTGSFSPPSGAEGGTAGAAGGGFTSGTITAVDGDTITLKLTDGSTVKVTTNSSTTVTKSDASSVSDLAKGEKLTVIGTAGSDGTVTATTVTEGETGGFGGGTPPSGSSSNG